MGLLEGYFKIVSLVVIAHLNHISERDLDTVYFLDKWK